MSDHYAITYPRAAYGKRCGECGERIGAGEHYARHFSANRDGVSTHRLCLTCQQWSDALDTANRAMGKWGISFGEDDSSWLWGGLWEAIGEFWRECLSPEAVAYREREEARMAPKFQAFGR